MDQSRFIAKHVVNLPKSGIRDFFDIVAKMKDAISLGVVAPVIQMLFHSSEVASWHRWSTILVNSHSASCAIAQ